MSPTDAAWHYERCFPRAEVNHRNLSMALVRSTPTPGRPSPADETTNNGFAHVVAAPVCALFPPWLADAEQSNERYAATDFTSPGIGPGSAAPGRVAFGARACRTPVRSEPRWCSSRCLSERSRVEANAWSGFKTTPSRGIAARAAMAYYEFPWPQRISFGVTNAAFHDPAPTTVIRKPF